MILTNFDTDLTQSSGYASQSVMHLYRCHASHPIGGVRASPLSSPSIPNIITTMIKLQQAHRIAVVIISSEAFSP